MEKYILLSTFATLTQEELELTKDWEETPLAVVAIAQEYIERWVLCSDYKSLDDFLNTSTYDVVEILAAEAERAGFLAFTYRPSLEPNFKFPEFCRGGALAAFADYLYPGEIPEGAQANSEKRAPGTPLLPYIQ